MSSAIYCKRNTSIKYHQRFLWLSWDIMKHHIKKDPQAENHILWKTAITESLRLKRRHMPKQTTKKWVSICLYKWRSDSPYCLPKVNLRNHQFDEVSHQLDILNCYINIFLKDGPSLSLVSSTWYNHPNFFFLHFSLILSYWWSNRSGNIE